jgi:hypothetical protein
LLSPENSDRLLALVETLLELTFPHGYESGKAGEPDSVTGQRAIDANEELTRAIVSLATGRGGEGLSLSPKDSDRLLALVDAASAAAFSFGYTAGRHDGPDPAAAQRASDAKKDLTRAIASLATGSGGEEDLAAQAAALYEEVLAHRRHARTCACRNACMTPDIAPAQYPS